ncbi:MAG: PEP-CTERM sorting domain-containing protein [Pirellulales bacterium]|nr:PEP-CTERM sorting domain-containing protein [Pirellulales bacterium]
MSKLFITSVFATSFILVGSLQIQAQVLFSENFENNLSHWTGQSYGSYSAMIVSDPLRPGNHVVGFAGVTFGGDIFSVPAVTLVEGQQYSLSLEYLGKAVYNSVPGDYGGYAGLCDIVQPNPYYRDASIWIMGTDPTDPYIRQGLIDDEQWQNYTYNFVWRKADVNAQYDTVHIVLEDFNGNGYRNSVGDVFFDNVQLTAVPEPSTIILLMIGGILLLVMPVFPIRSKRILCEFS